MCFTPSASYYVFAPVPHIGTATVTRGRRRAPRRVWARVRARGRAGESAAAAAGVSSRRGAPCPLCRPLSLGLDAAASSEPARASQRGSGGRRGGEGRRRGREEGKRGGREGGEEDPESARQLEFLQRLAGLQCTAAASRGGSRQPGSSGGGRASGGPAPCPLQTLRAARRGGRGRAREAGVGPRPRSRPPQRPPPPPQPRASPGSSRRLPRTPSLGPWALPGESPGRGGHSSGAAGHGLPRAGRCCPARSAEAQRALPGGSPAHLPRPGSGPAGRAWAARSDAAVPAWHQGHSARGGGDEGGQPRVATAAPESRRRGRRCCWLGSGLGGGKGCLESTHVSRPFCWTLRPRWTLQEELSSPAGSDSAPSVFLCCSRLPGASVEYLRSGLGLEEAATRAHTHTFRGGREAAAQAPSAVSMRRAR